MGRLSAIMLGTLAAVPLLTASPAAAQSQTERGMVFGSAGLHKLWDDESSIGTGIIAGGGVSVPLGGSWRVRGRVMRSHNKRDFGNGVVFENNATRYTAEALWQPGAGFLGAGVGGFAYDHEARYGPNPQDPRNPSGPTEVFRSNDTTLMYGVLGGATVWSNGRLRLQPEGGLWLSQDYFIAIEFGVTLGWSW